MSDLSVIDVQRELRKHADLGHDVTQGPHEVHVHGQPYRMRAHSYLWMPTRLRDHSSLHSLMTLSERPLLTEIDTTTGTNSEMAIHAKWPTIHHWEEDGEPQQEHGFSYTYHPDEEVHYYNHPEYGDWRQHGFTHLSYDSGTPDAHTVLQNHISKPWEYVGTENISGPSKETVKHHKNMSEFSTRFDLSKGLSSMIHRNMEPYHGLISVTSFGKNGGRHVYDPQTEKLTFLGRLR